MEILYTNCAGLDVHKKTVKVCLLTRTSDGQPHKEFRTYFTTTEELLKLGDWLKEQGCTHIAFEATGVYWKPVFNLLEGRFELLVVNAQHIKAVPDGRPMSRTPSGSPTCCSMACSKPALFPLALNESCVT
jgi:transposase